MSINVVNKHHGNVIGEYIGRPSVLGNPYSHLNNTKARYKCSSRDESVEKYEEYLRGEINKDISITKEMKRLYRKYKQDGELTLICWCSPHKCHGDVIKKILIEKLEMERPNE